LFLITKLSKLDKTFLLGCGKPAHHSELDSERRLSGGDAVAQPLTPDDGFVCFVGFVA
jgi:hypothetical protein